ncbi:MAG: copper amine oxidase N-terminal domain-containing protein, partial [Firmicutes bacterium]|nr:copper amine oxidase N-terminal domain-containing protein [Bacillota bacterium]
PEWSERYEAVHKSFSYYTSTENDSSAGRFSWCLGEGGILTDPDGYSSMPAEEILEDLFG